MFLNFVYDVYIDWIISHLISILFLTRKVTLIDSMTKISIFGYVSHIDFFLANFFLFSHLVRSYQQDSHQATVTRQIGSNEWNTEDQENKALVRFSYVIYA